MFRIRSHNTALSAPRARRIPASAVYNRARGLFRIIAQFQPGDEREVYRCVGYAGRGVGLNSPGASGIAGLGPLPGGEYDVGRPVDHPRLGPLAFPVVPRLGNMMFGRSGFMIHGDNRKGDRSASSGCIILDRPHREALLEFGVKSLLVV